MPKQASKAQNLQISHPQIAACWHKTKNVMQPTDVLAGSGKKAWWTCPICILDYHATISSQTKGHGCPYCSGRRFRPGESFQDLFPDLAKEWHPTKNLPLLPNQISPYNNRSIHWLCPRGHTWPAPLRNRTKLKSGCPKCSPATSKIELQFFAELKHIFPSAEHRKRIEKVECDIFIDEYRIAIEFDGFHFHKSVHKRDLKKAESLTMMGITLFRIRETGLKATCDTDVFYCESARYKDKALEILRTVKALLVQIKGQTTLNLSQGDLRRIDAYLTSTHLQNTDFANLLIQNMSRPKNSLLKTHPGLCEEWDYIENDPLTPEAFTRGSGQIVNWKCKKAHKWSASILSRTSANKGKGSRCPYCSNHKVNIDNCLATLNPELAKEIHPTKNEGITAEDIGIGDSKKYWWLCPSCGHIWEASVDSRNRGHGCRKCGIAKSAKTRSAAAAKTNGSVAEKYPTISQEWHPSKNAIGPDAVSPGSNMKVWWKCINEHEWEARVADRCLHNNGCKICKGKQASPENNLTITHPHLVQWWDHEKNAPLQPSDVLSGSDLEVYWKCENNHSFLSKVYDKTRAKGNGCSYCSGKKVMLEDSLQMKHPKICEDWDYERNEIKPTEVLPTSARKAFWVCKNKHKKQTEIRGRVATNGCPECKKI